MPLNAYMRLTGSVQGEIKGTVTQRGREGSISVIAFNHEVVSPRDAATGLPAGTRQHQPLTILKNIDATSPLLMRMLVTNENIAKWELRFWQPLPTGTESQYFTIQLHDASIAAIRQEMPNGMLPENKQQRERELVSFCYRKITWTDEITGHICADDWEAPVA